MFKTFLRQKEIDMAKKETSLQKFETVALGKEKAQQIKGGYMDISQMSFIQTAPNFVGWGEVEIRSNGFAVASFDSPVSSAIAPAGCLKRGR